MHIQISVATLAKRTKVVRSIHRLRAIRHGLIRPKTVRPFTLDAHVTLETTQSVWDLVQEEVLMMEGIPACFATCDICGKAGLMVTAQVEDAQGRIIGDTCANGCKPDNSQSHNDFKDVNSGGVI